VSQSLLNVIVESASGGRQPVVAGAGVPVAAIVDAAHEQGVTAALARWSAAGLDNAALEPILVYCAEQRCKADNATCPGCRLRTESLGLKSFDDFVGQFAEITFTGSAIRLPGAGSGSLTAQSLEHLAATWSGVE
jgi:tRNA/rRNA methyltransferase